MNKITKLLGVIFLGLVSLKNVSAQENKPCGTTEAMQDLFDADPKFYQEYLKENARLEALDKEAYAKGYKDDSRAAGTVYIIPVVFHVLHQNGPENISDAAIYAAIDFLNQDFRKLNADNANTIAAFQGISSDSEIEFRLAQKDPSGNCTNGIDRIYSSKTVVTGTSTSSKNTSKLNIWNRQNYLNIWTVKSFEDGIAGYAQFPGGSSTTDGIMILYDYVGVAGSRSHTLTHEVGHFLNLNHIWDCCSNIGTTCGSDGVSDTPTTRGHNNTCTTSSPCNSGVTENAQNFMDYSYCYTMFTAGQSTRMRSSLTTSSSRNNLWTTTNLTTNTGVSSDVLCKSDFQSSNPTNTVCQGGSLTFTDLALGGTPTTWSWTFEGGTPATSNVASPVITYNTPGTYSVSLSVSNGSSGPISTTKLAYVTVNSSSATYSTPIFSESFEGSAIPNSDWKVNNIAPLGSANGGNTWVQTTAASVTGTKSVRIVNSSTYDTYVDELISPSVDMTKMGSTPSLTFKVAHAQKASTGLGSADKLQVYVSTNCGLSWTLRKTMTGASLSTAGVSSTWTTPTSAQWTLQSVGLSGYTSQTNFYYMFRFTSNGGNNVYIEDINVSGPTGIEEELTNTISFNVYPNPAEENTVIGFNLLEKQKVQISLFDILGQQILNIYHGNLNAGEHYYPIVDQEKLSSGIYFVKLSVGDNVFTKKLIIK